MNKEQKREWSKAYYQKNKSAYRERKRRWQSANREKTREHVRTYRNRYAKLRRVRKQAIGQDQTLINQIDRALEVALLVARSPAPQPPQPAPNGYQEHVDYLTKT